MSGRRADRRSVRLSCCHPPDLCDGEGGLMHFDPKPGHSVIIIGGASPAR